MMKIKNYLLCMLGGISLVMSAYAENQDPGNYALMTAHDMQRIDLSNITITNLSGAPITVSGLFIASFDINDCSACFGSVVSGDNLGGAVVSPVTFKKNQTIPIGQNYLYNMLYSGIYYIKNTVGSSPCSLPGCSWPGDDPNVKGWCISINVISPNSSYTYSNYTNGSRPPANTPAYSNAGNSVPFNYKYDLIDPGTLGTGNRCLGPIACNDKTLTCRVATAQNESFQPYN
ncbi:hypothetical protein [Legionella donaldsonii]|uniref:hypothetical protein n=1 Tax=Legionella donaldsonii TaxID=45060 RepID=UPI00399D50AA